MQILRHARTLAAIDLVRNRRVRSAKIAGAAMLVLGVLAVEPRYLQRCYESIVVVSQNTERAYAERVRGVPGRERA